VSYETIYKFESYNYDLSMYYCLYQHISRLFDTFLAKYSMKIDNGNSLKWQFERNTMGLAKTLAFLSK